MAEESVKVLMVCLGNICRSPTAEVVFRAKLLAANLEHKVLVDSAGTGDWHVGHAPDKRAMQAATSRQYDMSALRGRQVTPADIEAFDYVFAMDRENLHNLLAISTPENRHKVSLFLHHGSSDVEEVPDPYYSGDEGFERVLDLIEDASERLVRTLAAKHSL